MLSSCMNICSQNTCYLTSKRKSQSNIKNSKLSLSQYDSHLISSELVSQQHINEIFLLEKAENCIMVYMRLMNFDEIEVKMNYFQHGICCLYDAYDGKTIENIILNNVYITKYIHYFSIFFFSF